MPTEGFELDVIRSAGLKGKSLAARARGAALVPVGLVDAWRVLSRRRPHVVMGVGGYSSGPVVLAAAMRRIPTLVLEQNAVPGIDEPPARAVGARRGGDLRADAVVLSAARASSRAIRFGAEFFQTSNVERSNFERSARSRPRRLPGRARNQRGDDGGGAAAGAARQRSRRWCIRRASAI